MSMPNIADAMRISGTPEKRKTKVLRGETAKRVLDKVTKKPTPKKGRSTSEVRQAMYGKEE